MHSAGKGFYCKSQRPQFYSWYPHIKGKPNSCKLSSGLHKWAVTRVCAWTHIHTCVQNKQKSNKTLIIFNVTTEKYNLF